MKNAKELYFILTSYLDDFALSCSEKELTHLKTDLSKCREKEDQITCNSIQGRVDKIRKSYKNIATFFTSSNNQYMDNLMPELLDVGDIRYCISIEKKYINTLDKLYQTVMSFFSNGSTSEINKAEKMSLVVFKQILNSVLIIIDNIISSSGSTPTKGEVERFINSILDAEKEYPSYHLEDYKKEVLLDKYLNLLNELDNQTT